jgi:hypothetical protein
MTISFNQLGTMGRLGNQLFQYASTRGIASNNDFQYSLSTGDAGVENLIEKYFYLKNVFTYVKNEKNFVEKKHNFDEELFNNCEDKINLIGYFQTDKYFNHIKKELIDDLIFKKKYDLPCENYISMHIRRTDYLNQQEHFPVIPIEYYHQALDKISSNLKIVIFSDDIEWCKKNITADFYIGNNSPDEALYLMTKANHNIIANSSFSWWGAWLNKNPDKLVVAPKIWFGPSSTNNNEDKIPNSWIQV